MNTNSREGHIDYVEFPAQSAESFAAAKRFYKQVFGWSFQEWGVEYADTKDEPDLKVTVDIDSVTVAAGGFPVGVGRSHGGAAHGGHQNPHGAPDLGGD